MKPNENIRFSYNGSTTAPSLEQLQPIRVNTDPLNIYIGNQDLDQSFRHNLSLNYSFYNVLKERNLWTSLNVDVTQNAFTQLNTLDSSGKRTYQTVNADGVYSINFYSDYGFKLKDTKWRLGAGPTFGTYRNIDFIRDEATGITQKNVTTNTNYGLSLNISQYVPDKYNFYIGPRITWNRSKASVNSNANAKYWQMEGYGGGSWQLPGKKLKMEVGSDINFQARQKDPRFPTNNTFTTWNAYVLKRFVENKFELKFSVNDILNQNRGYSRNFNSYNFTETYYNTLKRFWLLTFTYNFSKNGKPASF
jgi:hypothetical protein